MLLIVIFVEKLYIRSVRLPEGSGMSGTAVATATCLLSLAPFFADVVRANLGQKGHLDLSWVLKLQANQVSLLSCSRRILSCLMILRIMLIKSMPVHFVLLNQVVMKITNLQVAPLYVQIGSNP